MDSGNSMTDARREPVTDEQSKEIARAAFQIATELSPHANKEDVAFVRDKITAAYRALADRLAASEKALRQISIHGHLTGNTLAHMAQEVLDGKESHSENMQAKVPTMQILNESGGSVELSDVQGSVSPGRLHAINEPLQQRLAEMERERQRDALDGQAALDLLNRQLTDAQTTIANLRAERVKDTSECVSLTNRLTKAEQQMARLRELVVSAKCPTCDGSGWYHDTDSLTGEPVQAQCRWCTEQQALRETGA